MVLDLSTPENEYAALMYPVAQVFDWDDWQDGFDEHWRGDQNESVRQEFRSVQAPGAGELQVLPRAGDRAGPVDIEGSRVRRVREGQHRRQAARRIRAGDGHVCRLRPRTAQGLVRRRCTTRAGTAASPRRCGRPDSEAGIIAGVSQHRLPAGDLAVSTRASAGATAEQAGKQGKELPAVTGNRQALLNLPLEAYKKYEKQVERGFMQAAKFLHMLHIYRIFDLPYQSQIVPLAAILADIGDAWEHDANRAKLVRWYWNGVFGELYGSAVETRIARDFMEVPAWLAGRPGAIDGQRDDLPRRPTQDHADAAVRRLQGRERAA